MPSHVVGIDLGGTNMQIGVVDETGAIIGRARDRTVASEGVDAVIGRMVKGIESACATAGIGVRDLEAVGVGAPAPIDKTNRVVINAVNLRWIDIPLADLMTERLGGVFVTLDNDVNVAVWGERQFGAARGHDDVLGIWVGTGIGGGLVIDGRLHHGTFGTAGEIGRGIIYPNVGRGSNLLEEQASRTAIVQTIKKLISTNHDSLVKDLVKGDLDAITIFHVKDAIDAGDELACSVVRHAAELVGIAAANSVTLLSMGCVVLGGGVTEAIGPPYVAWVREAFDRAVFPDVCRQCEIRSTELLDNAGLLGAAALARERVRSRNA